VLKYVRISSSTFSLKSSHRGQQLPGEWGSRAAAEPCWRQCWEGHVT